MPNAETHLPRPRVVDAEYSYRRPLRTRELLPAIAVAVGAGLLAFYLARLLLQRTPMRIARGSSRARLEVPERTAIR